MTLGQTYDVAICGGGLAGLTLARQLALHAPERSVVVIDSLSSPLPTAAFKVGESTTEAAAYYLAETLQLREYLGQNHLFKMGFRFFFGNANGAFKDRPEFGLGDFPVVPSFNVDRGILENDLRKLNAENDITTLERTIVRNIDLSSTDALHQIGYLKESDGIEGTIAARWVVDATGRRRFLQKKLNLGKPFGRECNAVWFRLKGRIDVTDLVPPEETAWHDRVRDRKRYYSTNHLMGRGYWIWIIPLPSDATSIGIVALDTIHPFTEFNNYKRALGWLQKHESTFAAYIAGRELLDFLWMKRYSYSSRQVFSPQRWACIGEAGVFSDPLYAPGADLIAIGNLMVADMIRRDFAGELTPEIVSNHDLTIIALNEALTRNIQIGYPLFSNPVVTASKIMWDTAAGWALLAPQIYNSVFTDTEKNVRIRKAKAGYFLLAQSMHRLFADWEARSTNRCTFEFVDFLKIPLLLQLRQRNLKGGKSTQELVDDYVFNMERIEELAQVIFMLAVRDVMPEFLAEFPKPLWLNAWAVSLHHGRWEQDGLFRPTSSVRDLSLIEEQISGLFQFP